MSGLYGAVGGVNREIKKLYGSVNGVNREIKELWAAKDGVNRKIYTSIELGGMVTFGGYPYTVINVDNALHQAVIMLYSTTKTSLQAYFDYTHFTAVWKTSDLRANLNGAFYNTLSESEKARIVPRTNYQNAETGIGETVTDNIWIISGTELIGGSANDPGFQLTTQNKTDTFRAQLFGSTDCWLRDGYGRTEEAINDRGIMYDQNVTYGYQSSKGFRPTMIISI
jgi:hypothetical protein